MSAIEIYYDFEKNQLHVGPQEKEVFLTSHEEKLLEIVMGFLSSYSDVSMIGIEKRSNDYTSIMYGGVNDFLRFKFSDRTKWISLRLPIELQTVNIENPLFSAQKNKKQLHWKSKLNSLDDLELLKPFIIASCSP